MSLGYTVSSYISLALSSLYVSQLANVGNIFSSSRRVLPAWKMEDNPNLIFHSHYNFDVFEDVCIEIV